MNSNLLNNQGDGCGGGRAEGEGGVEKGGCEAGTHANGLQDPSPTR